MASHFYDWRHGSLHFIKRGWGDPLLLLHNLYPGASHEEFEHNINALAQHHTVYAPDLLGFGQSAAPSIKYTAQAYVRMIVEFIKDVVGTDQRVSVVAAGLSCGYVGSPGTELEFAL